MEPIVRVCTRRRRLSRVFSGLIASTCLWLGAAVVAQETAAPPAADAPPAAEATPSPAAPAVEEVKYDPPLTDAAKVKDWQTKQNGELRLKQTLKLDRLGNGDRDILSGAVQHYLYRMTIKEESSNLHSIVQKLIETVNSRQLTTVEARNFVNDEIVRIGQELLGQPPEVRLNLLILAASLISDPATTPPRPYAGATPLFLTVLDDPQQPPAAKIWAANGLRRICRDGDIPITQRDNIATHLVTALSAPDALSQANWFYRLRLVDALGDTQLCYNLQRQPTIIDALISVLSSRKEHWMVRGSAARSVTQLPWQPADQVNVPLVTYLVCEYARDAAHARNTNLNAPHWKYCILSAYLSFNPATAEQKAKNWGLLQKVKQPGYTEHAPLVESAYRALLPVVNTVMGSVTPKPVPGEQLQVLDDWLKNNVPADRKATPSSKQVDQTEQQRQRTVRVGEP